MIEAFERHGIDVMHAWGMTETSPLGVSNPLDAMEDALPLERRVALKERQGRPLFGVDMRISDPTGAPLPHDGVAQGDLQVRGPWIVSGYFRRDDADAFVDGWFRTGDIATIDPAGRMAIVDRTKDMIKSGGEWISSIALENLAVGCPGVAEAAVVGVAHPRWDERPLLLVVPAAGHDLSPDTVRAHLTGKVAKWWLPDAILMVEALPHTATGKLLKTKLRETYADHYRT
jgi:fatty-acyl-CoA synthase